ncbi:MAG TPA: hypothetical protein VF622_05920 [Segetibacter sp.]|jgi:hypothetical protein
MKNIIFFAFIITALTTSCTKMTNRGVEIEYRTDTVNAAAKDTIFVMDTANWNAFSYSTKGLVQPSDTTYFNSSEGIRFLNKNFRTGLRLQTKTEVNFKNKTIYYKYKVETNNQYVIATMVKYDPLTTDQFPAIQGVYFSSFSLAPQFPGIPTIQTNVWYYTRVRPIIGTDNYEAITATGNYDNSGGVVTYKSIIPVYTKSGYISIMFVDNHDTAGFATLGEVKILDK